MSTLDEKLRAAYGGSPNSTMNGNGNHQPGPTVIVGTVTSSQVVDTNPAESILAEVLPQLIGRTKREAERMVPSVAPHIAEATWVAELAAHRAAESMRAGVVVGQRVTEQIEKNDAYLEAKTLTNPNRRDQLTRMWEDINDTSMQLPVATMKGVARRFFVPPEPQPEPQGFLGGLFNR